MEDLRERIKQLEQALDMAQLVSSQYRDVFFDCLNFSSRGKLSPNDARVMLMHYIAMLSEKQKCLSETSPATYKKLRQEIEKLRADREKLVEALRFYADQRNWMGYHRDVDIIGSNDTEPGVALSDGFEIMLGGKLARTTLKELGELE